MKILTKKEQRAKKSAKILTKKEQRAIKEAKKEAKIEVARFNKEISIVYKAGLFSKFDVKAVIESDDWAGAVSRATKYHRIKVQNSIVLPEGYVEVNEFVISLGYAKSNARNVIRQIGADIFYIAANKRYYSPESQELARAYQKAKQARAYDQHGGIAAMVRGNLMGLEATAFYNKGIHGNVFSDYALAVSGKGTTEYLTINGGRIDNLIVNGNDYHILEFKTGSVYTRHEVQVRRYAIDLVEEFGKDINIIIHKVYSDYSDFNSVVSADAHSVVSDYEDAKAIYNENREGKLND